MCFGSPYVGIQSQPHSQMAFSSCLSSYFIHWRGPYSRCTIHILVHITLDYHCFPLLPLGCDSMRGKKSRLVSIFKSHSQKLNVCISPCIFEGAWNVKKPRESENIRPIAGMAMRLSFLLKNLYHSQLVLSRKPESLLKVSVKKNIFIRHSL